MGWLRVPYVAVMLGTHLPVAGLYVGHALRRLDPEDRRQAWREVRPWFILLACVWGVVVVGFAVWLSTDFAALVSGERSQLLNRCVFWLFHGMWWPFVMPVFFKVQRAIAELGVGGSATAATVRTASLRLRRVDDYLPMWTRAVPIVIAFAAPVVIGTRALWKPALGWEFLWGAVWFGGFAYFPLIFHIFWVRSEVRMPYPATGEGEAACEYREAAERLRRFRVVSAFAFEMAFSLVFFGASLLFVETGRGTISGTTAGLVGGSAGAIFGCIGAAWGIVAGLRAQSLSILHAKLTAQPEQTESEAPA